MMMIDLGQVSPNTSVRYHAYYLLLYFQLFSPNDRPLYVI